MEAKGKEPNAEAPPSRFFIGGEVGKFATLQELREAMVEVDERLVAILAERAEFVRQAALFKADIAESKAPKQQARNIDRAADTAKAAGSKLPGFPEIVRSIYEVMVPQYVAAQHEAMNRTQLKTEGHPMEPEIWDMGDGSHRKRVIDNWNERIGQAA